MISTLIKKNDKFHFLEALSITGFCWERVNTGPVWTPVEGWKVSLSEPIQGPSEGAFENKKDTVIGG